ncbi:ferritin light chain [Pogona vitticeps]
MAEPNPKRLKSGLPFCAVHRQQGRPPGNPVKQNFPPVVEEGLCGVTSAVLEVASVFQMLGEIFSDSNMALPNVSKFFLDQAKEEREVADALVQYQRVRGSIYCSRIITKPPNMLLNGVAPALEVALVQLKTVTSYFEELYTLSIKYSDPCTASTIKKQFLRSKSKKIKLMGDLLSNAHRLRSTQDGRGGLENYLIECSLKELKIGPDSETHCDLCVPLQRCTGVAKQLLLLHQEFPQHRNNGRSKYPELYCFLYQPRWKGLCEANRRQEEKWL